MAAWRYLVKSLIPVCDPAIKRAQVRGQLESSCAAWSTGWPASTARPTATRAPRSATSCTRCCAASPTCIQQQLFGELVAALQIADTALREIYFRIAMAQPSEEGAGQERQAAARRGAVDRRRRRHRRHLRRCLRRGARPRGPAFRRDRGPGGALRPRGRRVLAGEHAPRRRRREGAVAFRRRPPASRLADRRADGRRPSPEADRPAVATRSARWRTPPTPSGRRSPSARCARPPRR